MELAFAHVLKIDEKLEHATICIPHQRVGSILEQTEISLSLSHLQILHQICFPGWLVKLASPVNGARCLTNVSLFPSLLLSFSLHVITLSQAK